MREANVEFKAELRDRGLARGLLARLGFERVGVLDQVDTYYRVVGGRLKRRESSWAQREQASLSGPGEPEHAEPARLTEPAPGLSERTEPSDAGPRVEYIRYERPDRAAARTSRYERLTENEHRARYGPTPLAQIAVVRKRRELWVRGPARAHLDEVESLGAFAEIEVVSTGRQSEASGEAEALREALAPALGELIAVGYLDLLLAAADESSGLSGHDEDGR